ncbi:FdhF/YdeP family oxidoreductase [Echinimonas agarilytica]|uniref:FdhF/YdeP family oxidoreductase n=1 Tax=Echinimonas agarilytica TaxID=1215918 RepID=A0AA42B8F0_9GAMM|nr:FdhF/YdeP family oxidoreductase [Echinimonas agarilytica]MCM2680844.1 FdhF/YdeP family oxidoreductase [Echinimonas agarilytica]
MSKQPNKAGGLSSLQSAVKHVWKSQQAKTNIKNLMRANQTHGFDCPGCAWGDQKEGLIQFCENGAKAISWESTNKKVDSNFFENHTVSQLLKQSDYWLEYQGRLTEPLRYNPTTDKYEPIAWTKAFDLIGRQLNSLSSPNEAEFYTSGRASNEVSFVYQLFGRLFGTNNFPDCSNMCHEASGVALNQAIGVGKGTVVLDDFDKADAILVFGQNPGSNHPRMMNALRRAARHGCKIVTFNNLKEVALKRFASPQSPVELLTPAATDISHLYLSPKLGGDMAAIRGMVKTILAKQQAAIQSGQADVIDKAFIDEHTVDFESYCKQVQQTSWQQIEQQSGLSQPEIEAATDILLQAEKAICTWAMGITQHKHSVATIREIVNLQLITGNLGKPGAGLCPVRGHSNVQGNRTMGINDKPKQAFLNAMADHFQQPMPHDHGHNVYLALNAFLNKQSKVLICLGGNLAAAAPDTEQTFKAMRNTQLNVQISTKLNRSHLMVGQEALILPCLGRTEIDRQATGEQAITVEDTFSMVHASQGKVEPLDEQLKSEVDIICSIAQATLGKDIVDWKNLVADYGNIRDLVAQIVPGFADFNQKIMQPGGFYLGNSAADKHWVNDAGKAQFSQSPLPESITHDVAIDNTEGTKNRLMTLQTLRSHDQYNTTIYGMNDRYRGVSGERKVLFMNEKDAKRQKLKQGDKVQITSIWPDDQHRQVDGFKIEIYDIPEGNLAAYYPETNPLVPLDSVGDDSFTPTSKSVPVILKQSSQDAPIL